MRSNRRRGYFALEAILCLLMIVGLISLLAITLDRHARFMRRLTDDRAAESIAEKALSDLQTGHDPSVDPESRVTIQRLPDTAPTGLSWTRIDVRYHGRGQSIFGLTPRAGGRP